MRTRDVMLSMAADDRQQFIYDFAVRVWGAQAGSQRERALRMVEEALELGQAAGVTWDDVARLAARVYGRPAGEAWQEVGGVIVCVRALCQAMGLSAEYCEVREIERVTSMPLEELQRRHRLKLAAGLTDEARHGVGPGSASTRNIIPMDPVTGDRDQ
jgi:PAS domain-containing protein